MENKKNIALLFFGRINFCKKSFKTLKKAINFKENNIYTFLSSDNSSTEDLNDFIKLYKPVKYNNNEIKYKNDKLLKKLNNKPRTIYINPNMFKHFINRKRVTKLLIDYIYENNKHFDIIITLRADLHFGKKIELIFPLEENTIYTPNYNNWCGVNDQIHYSDLNTMFKINNVFTNLDYINYNNIVNIKHPELIIHNNKNIYNINHNIFDIDYYIIRN